MARTASFSPPEFPTGGRDDRPRSLQAIQRYVWARCGRLAVTRVGAAAAYEAASERYLVSLWRRGGCAHFARLIAGGHPATCGTDPRAGRGTDDSSRRRTRGHDRRV